MAIDKKIKYEMQGDEKPARNYLGKQKTVRVPVKWKSGPGKPATQLAYITKAEKDLILKKNLHGSLKNGPNTGPSGIMSLDDQGDYTQDRSPEGRQSSPGGPDRSRISQDKHEQHMREILTGQKNIGQTSAVSDRVREGAVPEIAYGPDGQPKYIGSSSKWVGKSLFNPSGYRNIQNKRGGFFGFGGKKDIRFNPVTQRYEFEEEGTGDVKPGIGGRIFGGLLSLLTGIPFVGGAIGSAYDYGKGIFGNKPKDMSQYNQLGLFGQVPEDFNRNRNISTDMGDSAWADGTFTWGKTPINASVKKGIPYTNQFTMSGNTYPVNQNFTDTMTTYTDAIEQGKNIGDDEQIYVDNEIANMRWP